VAAREALRKQHLSLDGAMDGPHFAAYIEQILAPTLKKGDIVFMDNVSTHLVASVKERSLCRDAIHI
jgi:transposase